VTAAKRDRELRKRDHRAEKAERRARGMLALITDREQRYNRGPQPRPTYRG
jgi:hypothetical protein